MRRLQLIHRITGRLGALRHRVSLANSINLTDINVVAENFYRDLLNLIYGYNLTNANFGDPNTAAIDLADRTARFAIQVTSTASLSKVRKTVKKFVQHDLHKQYDRLVVLNIAQKLDYKAAQVGEAGVFIINTTGDIWDSRDLVREIQNLSVPRLEQIANFLEDELADALDEPLSREIETIMELIEILSADECACGNGEFIEEPDPEGKINHRFADHAPFLRQLYQSLYVEYGAILDDALKGSHLGQPRIRRLGLHLQTTSNNILTEKNGDARAAFEVLVNKYSRLLHGHGISYDESAVRFFLVDQLIRCNVFPNKTAPIHV